MYFAVESFEAETLLRSLTTLIKSTSLAPPKSGPLWFALVDGAFDHEKRALSWRTEKVQIYDTDTNLAALMEVSPYLVALPAPDQTDFADQLRRLLQHCKGRPMLSFLSIESAAQTLRKQWQSCLMLPTADDDEPYLLRLADTRVLPALASLQDKALWQALTHTIDQWWFIDRTGDLQALQVEANEKSISIRSDGALPLELSHKNLRYLLSCGQADSVVDAIAEQLPEMLPERHRAQFHEHVARACALAERQQVEAFPDVMALAVASELTQGEILNDRRVLTRLAERKWADGQLSDALMDYLPEETL